MYNYVTSFGQVADFVSGIQKAEILGFDIETTGKRFFHDKVLLVQVKVLDTIYIFDARKLGDNIMRYVCQLIKDSGKLLVGHNIKFDIKFIRTNYGETFENVYDIMLAEIMINNGLDKGKERWYSLAQLVEKYCQVQLNKDTREEFYLQENPVITEEMLMYSAMDVQFLEEIMHKQEQILVTQKQRNVMYKEQLLEPVIASMEFNGVLLDQEQWNLLLKDAVEGVDKLYKDLVEELITKVFESRQFNNALEVVDFLHLDVKTKRDRQLWESVTEFSFIKEKVIEKFNIGSPKQMYIVLHDVYGIPVPDTNEKTLNKFELEYPIISKIFEYREYAKKVQTYGDPFFEAIDPATGRIHTEFNQLGMVSGRISSSRPNLQNIPRSQDYRKAFIARPGKKIIALDFSQEELRLLAVVAKVAKMIEAYRNGIDLHIMTASGLFKVAVESVTKEQRSKGKTMNFAVGYGSTEYGLWKNFGIPIEEGREYLHIFFDEVYPEINQAKAIVGEHIFRLGYSTTLDGRKRFFEMKTFFPGGQREKERWQASILREGFNHIIQGTGAEILKESLIDIYYRNPFGEKLKILIQVYDEIVCEADDDIAEEAQEFVKNIMLEKERRYLKDVVPAVVDGDKPAPHWVH